MNLIHLFLDLVVEGVALLGGEQTKVGVPQGGVRMMVFQGCKYFVTQEFVEALGHRGERFEVGIVKRADGGMVEHLDIGLAEDQVDRIRSRAIG